MRTVIKDEVEVEHDVCEEDEVDDTGTEGSRERGLSVFPLSSVNTRHNTDGVFAKIGSSKKGRRVAGEARSRRDGQVSAHDTGSHCTHMLKT